MRIPAQFGLFIAAICVVSPVFAELTISDLPYIQGTPLAEESWEIQDYAQTDTGIHWVWLQHGASTAYIVYPSEENTLLPDNSLVSASSDQMTLRFAGDINQELLFTRFSSALFTLVGDDIQVRYTAVTANLPSGEYPGDLSVRAGEIHVEGELFLVGNLELNAPDHIGLYGTINVSNQLKIDANTGVIMGLVESNGTVLDSCGQYSGATLTSMHVHIDTTFTTKGCLGDLVLPSENSLELNMGVLESNAGNVANVQTSTKTSGGSKGGNIDWWWFGFCVSILFRKRSSR